MPDPFHLALIDYIPGLLNFLVQTAGDAADQVADGLSQAAGDADGGGAGVAENLGGNFDPLTGDPVGGGDTSGATAPSGDVATGDANATNGATPATPPSFFQAFFSNPLLLFGGLMLLLYVMVLSPERRKQAEIAKKRAALKKNDRVVTTGGILGTVVSVSSDSDEVTLRVDESTNTRIRVLKSAIGSVLDAGKNKDKPEASS